MKAPIANKKSNTEDELSEEYIRKHCPHCDHKSEAYKYLLEETESFYIVCDVHPITKGHILIIPKQHLSCIGEYPDNTYKELENLYQKVSDFLSQEYGSVSSFEHGKLSQTVFHSHVHFIPFKGTSSDIVPEENKLNRIDSLSKIKPIFKKHGGYLFFSIGNDKWMVDTTLAAPRFFRDRYALALKKPYRGNWKKMHLQENGSTKAELEAQSTQQCWKKHYVN